MRSKHFQGLSANPESSLVQFPASLSSLPSRVVCSDVMAGGQGSWQ